MASASRSTTSIPVPKAAKTVVKGKAGSKNGPGKKSTPAKAVKATFGSKKK